MSIAAESAIRAWVNALPIVGEGKPLSRGAYLRLQRSVADGPYAVLSRLGEAVNSPVAEDSPFTSARISAMVYAGNEETAEIAAAALRSAIEGLTGCPQPCGTTGVLALVADNYLGPVFVPMPADGGEQYCFQVVADFMLRQ